LYGRRVVYLVCLGVFVLLIIPCALAGSLEELIVVRFIGYVLFSFPFLATISAILEGDKVLVLD
jgi:MFS family permease